MLFQCLCGFKPVFYSTHSDDEPLKDLVDNRRKAKDEWIIINNISSMDFRNIDREIVNKAVAGLAKRKFTYRITEEVEGNEVL